MVMMLMLMLMVVVVVVGRMSHPTVHWQAHGQAE
jgi:hypothetical protein